MPVGAVTVRVQRDDVAAFMAAVADLEDGNTILEDDELEDALRTVSRFAAIIDGQLRRDF